METGDYTTYVETLRAHVEHIRHTPPFEILNWRPFKLMREASIQQMEEYIAEHQNIPGFHVLPAMRPFYHVIGGWELRVRQRINVPILRRIRT